MLKMKHIKIELENGAMIEYRYDDVEQLKRLLPSSLDIKIGDNVQLGDHITLSEDTQIGDDCILEDYVDIGLDVVLDDNVHLCQEVTVQPDVWITSGAIIAPCANVTGE